jgi:ribonuclease D
MQYMIIQDDQQLAQCCQNARQAARIALDSEFVRRRTFYPQLGLIQLYDGDQISLIDPLVIQEWQPLRELLQDPQMEKVLHASGEDLETFQHHLGVVPQPLWDTQILAAFVGGALSSSYTGLVQSHLQVLLDKQQQRTDWLVRPLQEKQLRYAAADVYYLLPLAEKLLGQLTSSPWQLAAQEECQWLVEQRTATIDPQQLYRQISHSHCLTPRSLACLKKLAAWRFSEAVTRNIALNFVIQEPVLWQIAREFPNSLQALRQCGLPPSVLHCYAQTLLTLVAEAQQLPNSFLPVQLPRLITESRYQAAVTAIKQLINSVAAQHQLPPALLASKRHIDHLLFWHWYAELRDQRRCPRLLQGWRSMLVGQSLNDLLAAY